MVMTTYVKLNLWVQNLLIVRHDLCVNTDDVVDMYVCIYVYMYDNAPSKASLVNMAIEALDSCSFSWFETDIIMRINQASTESVEGGIKSLLRILELLLFYKQVIWCQGHKVFMYFCRMTIFGEICILLRFLHCKKLNQNNRRAWVLL